MAQKLLKTAKNGLLYLNVQTVSYYYWTNKAVNQGFPLDRLAMDS